MATKGDPTKFLAEGSVAKSIFLGNILEENIFPFPRFSDEEKEILHMVIDSIDRFCDGKEALFRKFDREGKIDLEHVEQMKELGLFGLIIGEEYGGIGLSNSGYARAVQQASRRDSATTLTLGAHSSIGMKGLLLFGTDEQKQRYLPALASGEMIAAFCLTEPGSGSDAASISTTAVKQDDGCWLINGEKIWITNGSLASFYTVFARSDSDEGKITAFIVEKDFPGVSFGPKEDKLGIRGSITTSVILNNVKVPAENLLGEEGIGFKVAMSILNNGRTGLGGGCVGGLKLCIELSSRQAKERKQFGRSISEFGLVKEKIGQMALDCFTVESTVSMIGHYIDSGSLDYSIEAAMSKVYASEALWKASNEALQIAGGNGYMKEFPYEQLTRDSRINLIFEGTNEILRLYIALSGMKDAGSYLKDIGNAAGKIFNEPVKGFGLMSNYASRKLTQLTSIGGERLEVAPSLRDDARILELATIGLSREVERLLRKHRKDIIGKQFALKRIADTAIDIFVGLCTLSRVQMLVESKGEKKTEIERHFLRTFIQQAKRRIKGNLGSIEREEDELLSKISDYIVEQEGYHWDTLSL